MSLDIPKKPTDRKPPREEMIRQCDIFRRLMVGETLQEVAKTEGPITRQRAHQIATRVGKRLVQLAHYSGGPGFRVPIEAKIGGLRYWRRVQPYMLELLEEYRQLFLQQEGK